MKARENPFASERVLKIRYRPGDGGWTRILARLEQLKYRGAIVGPQGSGKTTLLEDLEIVLRQRGFATVPVSLSRERPFLHNQFWKRPLTCDHIVLLDGAEQLGPITWWRVRRRSRAAGGLIVTSHREGLLPTLISCHTSPELLTQIVRELDSDGLESSELRALYERHAGNLRSALRELYDRRAGIATTRE